MCICNIHLLLCIIIPAVFIDGNKLLLLLLVREPQNQNYTGYCCLIFLTKQYNGGETMTCFLEGFAAWMNQENSQYIPWILPP